MGRLTHRTSEGWTYFVTTKAFQSANILQSQETASVVVAKLLGIARKEIICCTSLL